ncbi:MAG: hypothetical protein R2867_46610 [Caldilineaceae bacterium]
MPTAASARHRHCCRAPADHATGVEPKENWDHTSPANHMDSGRVWPRFYICPANDRPTLPLAVLPGRGYDGGHRRGQEPVALAIVRAV